MEIEFDHSKEIKNLEKHGISLSLFSGFDMENAKVVIDDRKDYGEIRYNAAGYIGSRLYAATFTMRGHVFRVIRLHKANKREVKKHEQR